MNAFRDEFLPSAFEHRDVCVKGKRYRLGLFTSPNRAGKVYKTSEWQLLDATTGEIKGSIQFRDLVAGTTVLLRGTRRSGAPSTRSRPKRVARPAYQPPKKRPRAKTDYASVDKDHIRFMLLKYAVAQPDPIVHILDTPQGAVAFFKRVYPADFCKVRFVIFNSDPALVKAMRAQFAADGNVAVWDAAHYPPMASTFANDAPCLIWKDGCENKCSDGDFERMARLVRPGGRVAHTLTVRNRAGVKEKAMHRAAAAQAVAFGMHSSWTFAYSGSRGCKMLHAQSDRPLAAGELAKKP